MSVIVGVVTFLDLIRRLEVEAWDLTDTFLREIAPDIAHEGRTKIIVPRTWLIDRIGTWRKDGVANRAFVLMGPPGAGKSAFTYNIVFGGGDHAVVGYHFFRATIGFSTGPMGFVRSLSVALARRLPAYNTYPLWNSFLDELRSLGAGEGYEGALNYFHRVILKPLSDILADNPAGKVMIVLDGLDEVVNPDEHKAVVEVIHRLIVKGPANLRVFIAQRPLEGRAEGQHRHEFAKSSDVVDLEKTPDDCWRSDIAHFVDDWLKDSSLTESDPLYQAIKGNIDSIAKASGRSLLLACLLLRQLGEESRDCDLATFDFSKAPAELSEAYKRIFERTFGADEPAIEEYRKLAAPPFQTLSVARDSQPEPLIPRDGATGMQSHLHALNRKPQLHGFVQTDEPLERGSDDAGAQAYRFFHKSLPDWLLEKKSSSHFQFTPEIAHKTMADQCWRIFESLRDDADALADRISDNEAEPEPAFSFVLKHGIHHVLESGEGIQRAIAMADFFQAEDNQPVVEYLATSVSKYLCDPSGKVRELLLGLGKLKKSKLGDDIDTAMLAGLMKDFYQTEPLEAGISLLYQRRESWEKSLAILLAANNYVVRFNIGEVIANKVKSLDDGDQKGEILLDLTKDLDHADVNRFEVAAYAVRHIAGEAPGTIPGRAYERMQDRPIYVGCSALGDLCVNLALQGDGFEPPLRPAFKTPVWPHIRQDLADIAAIRAIRAGKSMAEIQCWDDIWADAQREYGQMAAIAEERLRIDLGEKKHKSVHNLLTDTVYYGLGNDSDKIAKAVDKMAELTPDQLYQVMRCLMAHPLWDVGEAAASALVSVVLTNRSAFEPVISRLLGLTKEGDVTDKETNALWRIRFGGVEAAYIFADYDGGRLFAEAVKHYHNHPASRIRALCAEDLVATILESPDEVEGALHSNAQYILRWIVDDDCWVVEHIYKLFNTLDACGRGTPKTCRDLMERAKSAPLFEGLEMPWKSMKREDFLKHIEERKWAMAGRRRDGRA